VVIKYSVEGPLCAAIKYVPEYQIKEARSLFFGFLENLEGSFLALIAKTVTLTNI
jgi:hypothetical protein